MKRHKGLSKKDRFYFHAAALWLGFLPALGLFFLSGLLTTLIADYIIKMPLNGDLFNIVWVIIYALTTAITIYITDPKTARLYRRDLILAAIIIAVIWFIL